MIEQGYVPKTKRQMQVKDNRTIKTKEEEEEEEIVES